MPYSWYSFRTASCVAAVAIVSALATAAPAHAQAITPHTDVQGDTYCRTRRLR